MTNLSVDILSRQTRTALVNAIAGTNLGNLSSKLRGQVDEDEAAVPIRVSGNVRVKASGEEPLGDLWLVWVDGTISDADTSLDNQDPSTNEGADITKTLDEMCSNQYVFHKLTNLKPQSDESLLTGSFSHQFTSKQKKRFGQAQGTPVLVAIIGRVIGDGALGTHKYTLNYKLEYAVRRSNVLDTY